MFEKEEEQEEVDKEEVVVEVGGGLRRRRRRRRSHLNDPCTTMQHLLSFFPSMHFQVFSSHFICRIYLVACVYYLSYLSAGISCFCIMETSK